MSLQLPVGKVLINKVANTPIPPSSIKTLAQLELEHIEQALAVTQNNKAKAAEALGITVKTLYNKLHVYGLFDKYASAK